MKSMFAKPLSKEAKARCRTASLSFRSSRRPACMVSMNRLVPLLLLAIVATLAVCPAASAVDPLTPVADRLTLRMDETPSTGYLWSLRIEDPDMLALVGEGFTRRSDNDMPGGDGGSHSYTFAAKKPGASELVFRLISHHEEVVETRRYIVVADAELCLIEHELFPESEETEPAKQPDLPDSPLGRDRNVFIDGQRVTLTLSENPTTGYLWSVRISRPEIVRLDGEYYTPDDVSEMIDGSGGRHSYTFSAKAKGATVVYFDLISHQEEIAEQMQYLITVDEALRVTEAKLNEAR